MTTVISVENLSKTYHLGQIGTGTFSRDLEVWWAKMRGKPNPLLRIGQSDHGNRDGEELWALQDVSFKVEQGEVLGIIGRNGAGKSTLLKILSRVTAPTSGKVKVKGRIASLLEVGTGFHPELTGRENIYLNGAILGMKRNEIDRKFDEIVDFSGVKKFIDTPVKRYSSGMYVRLAFAVAAHLEPEILVVDEVLAVGDAEFQKKCLGKMGDVAKEGRTVLFVSHNMAAVSSLCNKGMVLRNGMVDCPLTNVDLAIDNYLKQVTKITQSQVGERADRQGEGQIHITGFQAVDKDGHAQGFVSSGQFVEFRIYYECKENRAHGNIVSAISFTSLAGSFVTMLSNQVAAEPFYSIPGRGYLACQIKKLPLSPGSYVLNLVINEGGRIQDWLQEAIILTVESGDFFGTGRLPPASHAGVFFDQSWSLGKEYVIPK
jgi:lipopolysaccharide transport system ATP-binding protein